MPCGPIVPNPASHMKMIENDGAAVSRFLESAYWGCMSQCHHSNVSPGLITSTPVSEANNQFLPVMWFFQCFFTSRRVSAPHQLPRKSGKHILFNFVFWSPLWASKTTFSLIEIVRDWSVSGTCLFYWPNVFFCVVLSAGFHFVHISCPTIARNEYLLQQNSSNFVSLLPALLASLLCHVGQ